MTHNTRESAKKVLKEYYGYKGEQDVPDGLATVLEDWLHHQLQKAREETEKAYGGCHYCYGKGYGTQTAAWVGRGYYKKLPTMTFCTCERGKQLEQLLHSELDQDNI